MGENIEAVVYYLFFFLLLCNDNLAVLISLSDDCTVFGSEMTSLTLLLNIVAKSNHIN